MIRLDIEIYDVEADNFAQAKYLAHSYNDVLWTDDLDEALSFLRFAALDIDNGK